MSLDTNIHDKIQKILNLAERAGTEAEAQTAMAMAHAMLAKYALTLDDIHAHASEDIQPIISDDSVPYAKRGQAWQAWIYTAVAELNFCTCYIVNRHGIKRYVLVGRSTHVAAARDIAASLIRTGERLALQGVRTAAQPFGDLGVSFNAKAWVGSFLIGYGSRIHERAMALKTDAMRGVLPDQETGTALVLAPLYKREAQAVQAYLHSQGVHLRTGRSSRSTIKSPDGYQAGRAAGTHADLASRTRSLGSGGRALSA